MLHHFSHMRPLGAYLWKSIIRDQSKLGLRLGVTSSETWKDALTKRIAPTIENTRIGVTRKDVENLFEQRAFVFAGRTWKTANGQFVMPNCAVTYFGKPDGSEVVENCAYWFRQGVGCGVHVPDYVHFKSNHGLVEMLNRIGLEASKFADCTGRVPGLMVTMNDTNSYIMDFIHAKSTTNKMQYPGLHHMNISVMKTQVLQHEDHPSTYTSSSISNTDRVDPLVRRDLLEVIARQALQTGDPGLLWSNKSPKNLSTAPCGELLMMPNEVCTLGTIYLPRYIDQHGDFDSIFFEDTVFLGLKALYAVWDKYPRYLWKDNVIAIVDSQRRLGLGVFGLADLFSYMGLSYGSRGSLLLTKKIGQALQAGAQRFRTEFVFEDFSSLLACPPTGGIATWLKTSYGIEPHFGTESITTSTSSSFTRARSELFVMSVLQEFIDNGISKTVNLDNSITVEDVVELFALGYALGLKGLTIYRAPCSSSSC